MRDKTPNAESESQAEGERVAIRKAIDETEAPSRAEVKHPGKKPEPPSADDDRQPRKQPRKFPPSGTQSTP
jgi:hypothetical protein